MKRIEITCPECNTKHTPLIYPNGEWDNVCFYCNYIFHPSDLQKAIIENERITDDFYYFPR